MMRNIYHMPLRGRLRVAAQSRFGGYALMLLPAVWMVAYVSNGGESLAYLRDLAGLNFICIILGLWGVLHAEMVDNIPERAVCLKHLRLDNPCECWTCDPRTNQEGTT